MRSRPRQGSMILKVFGLWLQEGFSQKEPVFPKGVLSLKVQFKGSRDLVNRVKIRQRITRIKVLIS